MKSHVSVQEAPFDPRAEEQAVRQGNPGIGAVVTFLGLMRDSNEGDEVLSMTLEHYPGMTEKALRTIVDEAHERWELENIRLVHRVGELEPQDPIVLVVVASRHRDNAFRGCEFIIDYLKTRAPFWKKERTNKGDRWVESRHADARAAARWSDND